MLNGSTVQDGLPMRRTLLCDQHTFVRLAHKSVQLTHVVRYACGIEAILQGGFFINLSLLNQ